MRRLSVFAGRLGETARADDLHEHRQIIQIKHSIYP
jgi:hypothetical protein